MIALHEHGGIPVVDPSTADGLAPQIHHWQRAEVDEVAHEVLRHRVGMVGMVGVRVGRRRGRSA